MRRMVPIMFAVVLLFVGAWLAVDRSANDDATIPVSAPVPPVRQAPAVVETETAIVTEQAGSPAADGTSARQSDPDAWEVVEYGEFVKVREYRRQCETVRHFLGAGEGDDVTTCERRFEIDHPYALFTDEQLAQIAGTDGQAAFILAHRQLFPAEVGAAQDIEAGVNNVLNAMIRGAEGQALDLILDESVFSPHTDLRSFLLWTLVGEQLGIASEAQVDRMLTFREATTLSDMAAIEQRAAEIAGLIRDQRLIVLGTEF